MAFVVFALVMIQVGRVRDYLEVSVAERTKELTAANEELRLEIVDRKKAEDALRQSEAYLTEVQRLSHTGSFGWTPATGNVIWSDETFRIFQYDRATKPSNELVLQRIHPDDRAHVQQVRDRAASDGKDFDQEYRLLMPDGSVKYVHSVAHAAKDALDEFKLFGAVMDVTAAKEAENKMRQAQADLAHVTRVITLGELTASIAHEVNQPLAAVVTNAGACLRWLDRDPPNLTEARRAVEWIIKDGNRASEVIRRIRALANKTDTQSALLDINEVVNEVVALVQRERISHRVSLQLDLAPSLPMVLADRVQLQQVIINLVMNGIEATAPVTDRPRELKIVSRRESDKLLLAVHDSGVGINSEHVDRLFNAFFTTKRSGMGMGLSICRSIIEAHGGRIWSAPNSPHGATFTFTLPLHQENEL